MKDISKKEEHPWKRFPKNDNKAHSLILGSFPPIKFTNKRNDITRCDVDFFYGSKDNAFWELFIESKGLEMKWPDDEKKLMDWLELNGWAISDIILKANRKKESAYDIDLKDRDWNITIIDEIIINNPIEKIFFTSRFVENNFKENIYPCLKSNNRINKNGFVTLISPSRNGLRSMAWSYNLTSIPKQKDETLTAFRLRYYKEKL